MDGDDIFLEAARMSGADACIVGHLLRLFDTQSIEAAWEIHLERMSAFGFDRITYFNDPLCRSFDALEDVLILSNHPKWVVEEYIRQGHWRLAFFLSRAEREGADCMSWRPPPPDQITPAEARALAFRHAHGLIAGYSISLRSLTPRGRAGIGLCARRLDQDAVDALWQRRGPVLRVLNKAFHLRVSTLPRTSGASALSDRQREALEWAAAGKTVRDIAAIMGVSVATVEKHLRLAREKLGAQTTAEALVRASAWNQILRIDFAAMQRTLPASQEDPATGDDPIG